jgi:hypothetical protein
MLIKTRRLLLLSIFLGAAPPSLSHAEPVGPSQISDLHVRGPLTSGRSAPIELTFKINEPCINLMTEVQSLEDTEVIGGEPFLHYQCQSDKAEALKHTFLILAAKNETSRIRVLISYESNHRQVHEIRTLVAYPGHSTGSQFQADSLIGSK